MNRRELLVGATTLAVTGCSPQQARPAAGSAAAPATLSIPTDDPFTAAKLMADVEQYAGFGAHRSGSAGDVATSGMFAARWKALGFAVEQTEFPTPNADTRVAKLRFGAEAIDGFAQPPLSFTPEGGVVAPLVPWNPKSIADVFGRIALIHIPRTAGQPTPSAAYRDLYERASKAGAIGIVGCTSGPSGEPVAINTPVDMILDTPVLAVGDRDLPRLTAFAASKQPAKLIIEGPGGFRNGKNTIGRRGVEGKWIIISTPQSGWFTCGGERGPGIAMSLALSQWAAQKNFPVRFLFIATSGHEWADAGAHVFHEMQAPKPADTILWVHLGASFGARAFEETPAGLKPLDTPNTGRTLMATADMLPSLQAAFTGQPQLGQPLPADKATALGEYKLVAEEGYPSSFGFWGFNAHFHAPIDGANGTSGAIMEPIARAIAKVVEERIGRG